jgi:hypothetical protein
MDSDKIKLGMTVYWYSQLTRQVRHGVVAVLNGSRAGVRTSAGAVHGLPVARLCTTAEAAEKQGVK